MRWQIAVLALCLSLIAVPARADDPEPDPPGPWKFNTTVGLNLTQSAFSTNWAGGDRGSFLWVLTTQSSAVRQFSDHFNLANRLKLAYGQTSKQEKTTAGAVVWDSPSKTTDQILFESVGRWTLGGIVDPYAALGVESQFWDESDPRGRFSFNPIKVKESAGVARVLYKTEDSGGLSRLGLAYRQIFSRTFTDPLGQDERSFTTNDGGLEWQTDVKQPLMSKKVLYKGTLLVYETLVYSESSDLETVDQILIAATPGRESIQNFWKAPDVNFQNNFTAEITKVLNVNLDVQFVYDKYDVAALVDPALASSPDPATRDAYVAQLDKNVRKAGQFREVLAIGLTYRLF
jgi:DUF3078 family protein